MKFTAQTMNICPKIKITPPILTRFNTISHGFTQIYADSHRRILLLLLADKKYHEGMQPQGG